MATNNENINYSGIIDVSKIFQLAKEMWTDQSVEGRNKLQNCGFLHPYTCGNNECRAKTDGAPLLAVEGGWVCEYCGYTQKLR